MSGNSSYVRIERVTKRFGGFIAVDDVSLEIRRGEIFCLLGGSGSGKTTLLRVLAGFEQPSAGKVYIDGQDMSEVPAHQRPVNMMFQSYALFPHMSVERNVAFGLEQERVPRSEIRRRVDEMLELVKLTPFAPRKPHQLSGGQRQRVALACALVKRPKLLLLDEPLAALDRKLREHTQFELINIQERLGVTFVVVTHDQQEAMTLSSRMGVMSQGRIVQVGTPAEIYESPATRLVADFIGTVNLFEGRVIEGHLGSGADSSADARAIPGSGSAVHGLRILCAELGVVCVTPREADREFPVAAAPGATVWVALRPEKIALERMSEGAAGEAALTGEAEKAGGPASSVNRVDGVVQEVGYRGDASLYVVRIASGRAVRVTRPNTGGEGEPRLTRDERVSLSWHPSSPIVLTR